MNSQAAIRAFKDEYGEQAEPADETDPDQLHAYPPAASHPWSTAGGSVRMAIGWSFPARHAGTTSDPPARPRLRYRQAASRTCRTKNRDAPAPPFGPQCRLASREWRDDGGDQRSSRRRSRTEQIAQAGAPLAHDSTAPPLLKIYRILHPVKRLNSLKAEALPQSDSADRPAISRPSATQRRANRMLPPYNNLWRAKQPGPSEKG